MASYAIIVGDNGDGTFGLTVCNRGTTSTSVTAGTNLLTNTYTQSAATGVVTAASGFLDTATDTADGLGHKYRNPQEAIQRAVQILSNDRAFNG